MSILDSEKIMGRIVAKHKEIQEHLLIKDIIDIYNGDYKDYSAYKKLQELNIKNAKSFNNTDWDAYCDEQRVRYTIAVEPILLSEENFDYIKKTAESRKELENNIDN